MTRYLLNPSTINWLGLAFAILTPVVGIATLVLARQRRSWLQSLPLFWILTATGPLILVLWFVYNAIEDALGLDSVFALLTNLCLFSLIGLGLGAFVHYRTPGLRGESSRAEPKPPPETPSSDA